MKKNVMWVIFALALLLASCGTSDSEVTPTQGADAIYTSAAQTVSAQLTEAATRAIPTVTNTIEPTLTATTTLIPTVVPLFTATSALVLPTTAAGVCDKALFMADVTIPDGTKMDPGETFTKTWQLKNAGTCTWTTGYAIVFFDGKQMTDEDSINLDGTVAPGGTVNVSVDMTAPSTEGTYKSTWVLKNAAGTQISPTFYAEIKVGDGTADNDDASVTISDYSVDAGDSITVYVSGFPANEDIDYCLRLKSKSDCTKMKDGTTDSDGENSVKFTIPSDADSDSYWVVEVHTTERSEVITAVSDKIVIN